MTDLTHGAGAPPRQLRSHTDADSAHRSIATRIERALVALAILTLAALVAAAAIPAQARAQEARIRDLTLGDQAVPVRLMGYGLVVGLDGTGDRGIGARTSGHTVQSVANLLRRFDVEVPVEFLRTRNVAAVLVTAEVSPFLRAGGRFEIQVASVGDARSLRGGVLYMTPLVAEPGGPAIATAQGPLVMSDGGMLRRQYAVETSGRIPGGGIIEGELPRPIFASMSRLVLREPDLGTATRIAEAINAASPNVATVEDPGSIALALAPDDPNRAATLARIGELTVQRDVTPRLVIDGRDGTIVAGGDLTVGSATVSHSGITLSIGTPAAPAGAGAPAVAGDVQLPSGVPVQRVAAALHAAQATPDEIAAILSSLREVGAITAEVVVR